MLPSIFGENMMDEFFDRDFFGERNPLFGKHARNLMKTDIHENDKEYELSVELPGFKKEEISLDVKDGYLTISAQKGLDKDEEDKKGRVLRQERYSGVCTRSFYVGDVKAEDVKAKYESGEGRQEASFRKQDRHRINHIRRPPSAFPRRRRAFLKKSIFEKVCLWISKHCSTASSTYTFTPRLIW